MNWQEFQNSINHNHIDLGLDRIQKVYHQLTADYQFNPIIITVGGTNGKGSTCSFINSILIAHKFRVGLFSSPHILKFNERIQVNNIQINNTQLDKVFIEVEKARKKVNVSLTYFEISVLIAWIYFAKQNCQFVILEVGLGGRLDATNIWDSDIAIITSIAMDHQAYLGNSRAKIAIEKVAIARKNQILICSDYSPPASFFRQAEKIGAVVKLLGRDFEFDLINSKSWSLSIKNVKTRFNNLPRPKIFGNIQIQNAAVAISALHYLLVNKKYHLQLQKIKTGIVKTKIRARFERVKISQNRQIIFDVCHNQQATKVLVENLDGVKKNQSTKVHAVFGILKDKEISDLVQPLLKIFDSWFISNLPNNNRGQRADEIEKFIQKQFNQKRISKIITKYKNPISAFNAALDQSNKGDIIVIFGSFITVSECYPYIINSENRL